jgi:protein SCO1
MERKSNYYWLLLLAPLLLIAWYFISENKQQPLRTLPYFSPVGKIQKNDTDYHTVPAFSFTDQNGNKVDEHTVKDRIYVAEYFFTTCMSICPVMNDNLQKVYATFGRRPDFMILSHTVDPETDSVDVLKAYAEAHNIEDGNWRFVTGDKVSLYNQARKGYLLSAEEGKGDAEDFIHTQNFALVDKDRHIRGYYDGTDSLELNRLIQEIDILIKEYDYKTAPH